MSENKMEVTVTTKNTAALTMGIISIAIGVFAMLVSWIPFLGLFAIPVAVIGAFLAFIGVILALIKKFKGILMPLLGGIICFIAILISIGSTGSTSAAISEAINDSNKQTENTDLKAREDKNSYINSFIQLYDVEAAYHDTYLDGEVPGVLFKLKNTGDRTLIKVEVTVYFKDSEGNIIAEEDYYPVLVSDFSMNDSKPLKPGYVWSMEKNKFYSAKSVPSEWAEGAVDVKITDIDFASEDLSH